MPYIRCLLSLLFLVILAPPVLAQEAPSQPVRLELPLNVEEVEVEVIALPDSSLLVYHKTYDLWEREATFRFTKYNSQLEEVWADTTHLNADTEYIRSYTMAPYIYLAFGRDEFSDYTFVRLNYITGGISQKTFMVGQLDALYEFAVLQGNLFLIGNDSKEGKPLLVHLNPSTEEITPLPSLHGDQSSFSDLLADQEQKRVDVVISESNGRVARLQVKSFDAYGKLLNNYFILQKEDKSLLNAELTPGDTTQKMLFGTYGSRDLRFAQGFFAKPMASKELDGNFYSMLQLRNFFKYMKPRREQRLRTREEERFRKGRTPGANYRLLLHDLIETPTGYVLAAEAYHPQLNNASRTFRMEPIFLPSGDEYGYKRSHAVALGFDRNGVLLWDNTMPLKEIITPYLTHAVEVQPLTDGRVVMAYPESNKIVYQVMDDDRYADEQREVELLPYAESEKIQTTEYPGLIRWYGDSMAAFGFQRVKPKTGEIRQVFYINKITF